MIRIRRSKGQVEKNGPKEERQSNIETIGNDILTIKILTTKWGKLLRITKQRNTNFEFTASNEFGLVSDACPEILSTYQNTLYLRGEDKHADKKILVLPKSSVWLSKLRVAVKEYNEKYND